MTTERTISSLKIAFVTLMAHFHQQRGARIQIRIPNPIVTLYYAKLFPLVQSGTRIPVQIVSQMVTDLNPNRYLLVEMSHNSVLKQTFWENYVKVESG